MSATLEDVEKHKFVLRPGRYVGVPDRVDDDVSFGEKMIKLTGELNGQLDEEQQLNAEIKKQLKNVGYEL